MGCPNFAGRRPLSVRRRMHTTFLKHSSGMSKVATVVGLLVAPFLGFVAWMLYQDLREMTPMELAARSPIIVYARVDTNAPTNRLVIAEIWKDSRKTSIPGTIVGMHLPLRWSADAGPLPEGAVVFFQRDFRFFKISQLKPTAFYFVRAGRVENMTIREYKTACGLLN